VKQKGSAECGEKIGHIFKAEKKEETFRPQHLSHGKRSRTLRRAGLLGTTKDGTYEKLYNRRKEEKKLRALEKHRVMVVGQKKGNWGGAGGDVQWGYYLRKH